MRWGLVLAIVVACGANPPRRDEPVGPASPAVAAPGVSAPSVRRRVHRAHVGHTVSAARPAGGIADLLPDFHEELRWPLPATSHPELEPQYPIARELAIDVGWEELCARGVHRRNVPAQAEQLEYLRGWCSVLAHDVDAACRHLRPLLHSTRKRMAEAVRRDLANILVGHGTADAAEGYLTRNLIRDPRVLDLLAASYAELGRLDDAFAINRLAIDADSFATTATKCRRLARRIVLTRVQSDRALSIQQLHNYVVDPRKADPLCAALADAVACWHEPGFACTAHFRRHNLDMRALHVLAIYGAWPDSAGYAEWWRIGERLGLLLDVPGAVDLALAAYDASIAADPWCEGRRAISIHAAIDAIRAKPAHAVHEASLQQLARACAKPTQRTTTATP